MRGVKLLFSSSPTSACSSAFFSTSASSAAKDSGGNKKEEDEDAAAGADAAGGRGDSGSGSAGDELPAGGQFQAFTKQAGRVATLAGAGLAAYMVSSGALSFSHTLLTIKPITYLNIGFGFGVVFVAGVSALVYRLKASTFVRPEKLYYTAVHQLEENDEVAAKLGGCPETLHRADQVRVYGLQQGRLLNFLRPARVELAFCIDGSEHNGVASVVGEQSAWTGRMRLKTLAVHVLKDVPETVVLQGSAEEAEALRVKMADLKHEFRGLENVHFPKMLPRRGVGSE